MSEKHDLLATSKQCAECRAIRAYDPADTTVAKQHAFVQNVALAQAVRAAAGKMNPVGWALHGTLDGWSDFKSELSGIVYPRGTRYANPKVVAKFKREYYNREEA